MVVKRAEDSTRFDGDHAHSQLSALHPVDLGTKVNSREKLNGHTAGLWNSWIVAQSGLLGAGLKPDGARVGPHRE